MFAHVSAVLALEVLVLPVDALLHPLQQDAVLVLGEQRVPGRAPDDLDHVPAGAAEDAFQLLDDLAVAAHRAVEPLQVAVDDEDEVVEPFAAGERNRAQRFGFVAFAVAQERPHLAVAGLRESAPVEILEEARLVDGHQRAETHRHRRELPEIGHQPRVRIGRNAIALAFLAVVEELLLGKPPFDERTRINPRRDVTLHVEQVAAMAVGGRMPEMLEAHVIEQRRGLEARDVAAQFGRLLVCAQDDRDRVPADRRADLVLELAVAGRFFLVLWRNRVAIRRGGEKRRHRAGFQGLVAQPAEQPAHPFGPLLLQDRPQRVDPLLGLGRVVIVGDAHDASPLRMRLDVRVARDGARELCGSAQSPGRPCTRKISSRCGLIGRLRRSPDGSGFMNQRS